MCSLLAGPEGSRMSLDDGFFDYVFVVRRVRVVCSAGLKEKWKSCDLDSSNEIQKKKIIHPSIHPHGSVRHPSSSIELSIHQLPTHHVSSAVWIHHDFQLHVFGGSVDFPILHLWIPPRHERYHTHDESCGRKMDWEDGKINFMHHPTSSRLNRR